MKALKPVVVLFTVIGIVILLIPAVLVLPFTDHGTGGTLTEKHAVKVEQKKTSEAAAQPAVEVAVYRASKEKTQSIALENYVAGVVASEMPISFETEALKAQALAARTYIVSQLASGSHTGVPKGADVTDTELHQVYKDTTDLKKEWGADYAKNRQKIEKAVKETEGQILTYNGKPITASFFSTSNGYTENSEDYWGNSFPYLKSTASPWDQKSPKFTNKVVLSVTSFESKLGVKVPSGQTIGTVTGRTAGDRVASVTIGGKKLTGKQIRENLNLSSTDFNLERRGASIVITTKGYGHGVGMSQYGANGMAQEGKSYRDIVQYYYKGVKVQSSKTILHTLTARK